MAYGTQGSYLDVMNKEKKINLFSPALNQTSTQPRINLQQSNSIKGRGPTNLFIEERQAFDNMINSGVAEETAMQAIKQKRKELWGSTQLTQQESEALIKMAQSDIDIKTAIKAVKEKRYDQMSFGGKIGKNLFDLSTTGPALVTEQAYNLGSFLSGSDELKRKADEMRDFRKGTFENTIGGKSGTIITGAGELIAIGPKRTAPTMGGRIVQGGVVGGVTGGVDTILSGGNQATMGDVARNTAIGTVIGGASVPVIEKVAIPAIAGLFTKGVKYGTAGIKGGVPGLTKSIGRDINKSFVKPFQTKAQDTASSLALGGIINPAKLDAVRKGLMVEDGIATPSNVGKWMLDRVKPGNKQEIAEQLIKHSETSKKAVDDTLAKITTEIDNPSARKAAQTIADDLGDSLSPEMQREARRMQQLADKEALTLTEMQEIKRALDARYNIYKQSTEVRDTRISQDLNYLRQNIRKAIEDEAAKFGADIRKLNNETSVARGLAEGIMRKDSADAVRELLTAFAPSGIGSVIGAGQSIAQGNNPLVVLRDALIGGIGAKLLTSTRVRTNIASAINKLGPKELTSLKKYVQSGGADEVGKKVAEKVISSNKIKNINGNTIGNTNYNTSFLLKKKPQIVKETPKVIKKPSILSEKEKAKILEGKKKPSIIEQEKAKKVKQAVSKLTKENINEVAETIAKNYPGKLEQIKTVIREFIKKHGDKYIDKLSELVEEIATKVGAKLNLIGKDGAMKEVIKKSDVLSSIDKKRLIEQNKPITVFRGVSKSGKNFYTGDKELPFTYYSLAKDKASKYGDVKEYTFTSKGKTFRGSLYEKFNDVNANIEDIKIINKLKEEGYNSAIIKGDELVVFDKGLILDYTKGIDKTRVISKGDDLIKEARKYKSADEFIKAMNKKDYRSAHQLNLSDSITADKIDLPKLKEAIRARNGYLNNYVIKDLKKLEKIVGNPDAKVTIYRASPKAEINEGDWVTTDKSYAQYIKKVNGGVVNIFEVQVKDLRFPNDLDNLPSLQMATTFNYGPNIDRLKNIWEQAKKSK